MNTLVSIVIPTLNEEEHLQKLLASVSSQTYSGYEVIIADGGSSDKTLAIASSYGCKIVAGGSPAQGRNEGAKEAKGEILLFVDADVMLPPDFLEKAVAEFTKRNLGIAGFPVIVVTAHIIDKLANYFFNAFVRLTEKISPHAAMVTMVKKQAHEAIGGVDETVRFLEDLYYVRTAAKVAKYGCLHQLAFVSDRRYRQDGSIITYLKYVLAELYTIFIGPIRTDMFRYKFSHYGNEIRSTKSEIRKKSK